MFNRFTEKAQRAITLAQRVAKDRHLAKVTSTCLFIALLRAEKSFAQLFLVKAGITAAEAEALLPPPTRNDEEVPTQIGFDSEAKRHLEIAYEEARILGHHYIGTEHILLSLLTTKKDTSVTNLLDNKGITREQVITELQNDSEHTEKPVQKQANPGTGVDAWERRADNLARRAEAQERRNEALVRQSETIERRRETSSSTEPPNAADEEAKREHVISVRLDDASLASLDALVQADIFKSRSEAAHFLVKKGIAAQGGFISQVTQRLATIKGIQEELRQLFREQEATLTGNGKDLAVSLDDGSNWRVVDEHCTWSLFAQETSWTAQIRAEGIIPEYLSGGGKALFRFTVQDIQKKGFAYVDKAQKGISSPTAVLIHLTGEGPLE